MKYWVTGIIVFFATLAILSGCDEGKTTIADKPFDITISKNVFEGHHYLIFRTDNHKGGGGVVHDPACSKCLETKKSKAEVEQ